MIMRPRQRRAGLDDGADTAIGLQAASNSPRGGRELSGYRKSRRASSEAGQSSGHSRLSFWLAPSRRTSTASYRAAVVCACKRFGTRGILAKGEALGVGSRESGHSSASVGDVPRSASQEKLYCEIMNDCKWNTSGHDSLPSSRPSGEPGRIERSYSVSLDPKTPRTLETRGNANGGEIG